MVTLKRREVTLKFSVQGLHTACVSLASSALVWLAACGQSSQPNDTGAAAGGPPASGGGSSGNGAAAGQAPVVAGSPGAAGAAGAASGGAPATEVAGASGVAGASAGASNSQAGAQSGGASGQGGGSVAGSSSAGGGPIGGPSNGTDKITIWLSGDSTMANGSNPCPVGWGKQFQAHFNANAKVVNSAVGGTTIRSWLYNVTSTLGSDGECTLSSPTPQAHWTDMTTGMKKGDYLFIQFGINDSTAPSCPKHVSVDTFKTLLGRMAQAAKDKGAQPVFLTAVSSISCSGSVAKGTRGGFATATKDAATQYGVPVIDLEQLSVALYTSLNFCPSTDSAATFSANTPIGNFFCDDHTHFEAAGSVQIANLVAKALRDQGFGLANYLVP